MPQSLFRELEAYHDRPMDIAGRERLSPGVHHNTLARVCSKTDPLWGKSGRKDIQGGAGAVQKTSGEAGDGERWPVPQPNISIVPKKDGSQRPVVNLKALNQFVTRQKFKMEGARSIRDLHAQMYTKYSGWDSQSPTHVVVVLVPSTLSAKDDLTGPEWFKVIITLYGDGKDT